jgi:predicted amidophosphoribosyltransferase
VEERPDVVARVVDVLRRFSMSLPGCTECGQQLSASASTCPECGHPVHQGAVPIANLADPHRNDIETSGAW